MFNLKIARFFTTALLAAFGNCRTGNDGNALKTKIYQYLPPNWTFGPNTTNITFRNLLEHRSGIASDADIDYSGIRLDIARPVPFK